jgi:hypothetical protein
MMVKCDHTVIAARVPRWWRIQFQAKCEARGTTMSEALRETIATTWGLQRPEADTERRREEVGGEG